MSCPSQARVFELLASYPAVYALCWSQGAFGRWVLARGGGHGVGWTLNTTWQVDLFLLQPHRDIKNWTNSSCKRLEPRAAIFNASWIMTSQPLRSWADTFSLLSSFLQRVTKIPRKVPNTTAMSTMAVLYRTLKNISVVNVLVGIWCFRSVYHEIHDY